MRLIDLSRRSRLNERQRYGLLQPQKNTAMRPSGGGKRVSLGLVHARQIGLFFPGLAIGPTHGVLSAPASISTCRNRYPITEGKLWG